MVMLMMHLWEDIDLDLSPGGAVSEIYLLHIRTIGDQPFQSHAQHGGLILKYYQLKIEDKMYKFLLLYIMYIFDL